MKVKPFTVEVFRHGAYKRRRKFDTRDDAVRWVNDFQDDRSDEDGWQCQLVHANGQLEQFGINGNNR